MPLGSRKFEQETGIKSSEWFGKLWARWSDALLEAGFTPNQLQGAYDKIDLLDKYAKLAQELNRLPTSGDLRLKTRTDATFPSNSTFENRFDTKLELVKQLGDYCKGHNQYEDVVSLCATYVSPKRNASEEIKVQEDQTGFVYLIKSGRFHKIGRANSAGRREYEIALQLPEKPRLFTLFEPMIQAALKPTGTTDLQESEKMVNGLN